MSSILHCLTIDAAPEHVQQLVATKEGIELWWTGQPVAGDDSVGGQIAVSFGDRTAATFEVVEQTRERTVWRCVGGPSDWLDTTISFTFEPRTDGGTTLRFNHAGWQDETDLMYGCSTNWGAYLDEPQVRSRRARLRRLPARGDQPVELTATHFASPAQTKPA